jgi:hyaluronoglucosaminidase
MSSKLVGCLEGFYGRPWSTLQRTELLENLQSWNMNAYMYSPKDDRKHRAAWRELYDDSEVVA